MKHKKGKLLRKILWTTLWGALETGVLLGSQWVSNTINLKNNVTVIAISMIVFFVLSYIIEKVEDKT
jgi:hypothetical protein